MTRLQKLEQDGLAPDMPPLTIAGHLVDYLMDAGPCVHSGMGAMPLGHAEIAAWQSNIGVTLSAWEARTLRSLSAAYVVATKTAEEPDEPPPYLPAAVSDARRDAVARQIKDVFANRAKGAEAS